LQIETEDVTKKLQKLKISKSAGPDGFHPRVLKETAKAISPVMANIFNKSLTEKTVPTKWKDGHITAIHKKGKKTMAENYRPISLTSVIGKVMEKFVRDALVDHMIKHNLFCDAQHGFVPGRSCMTQLLVTLEMWTEMIDKSEPIDVIYLDFKKAFDTVPHHRLISKLKAYGISGPLLDWIKDFLTDRRQKVIVNQKSSEFKTVTSGIPQGSVLGPILFVIFINDLPETVKTTVKIFADDTKLFHCTKTAQQQQQLQDDLNKLTQWSEEWQLLFNENKCKVMHLGRNNQHKEYKMNKTTLEAVNEEKDLGVIIDNKLLFHNHVATAVNKASRLLGLIKGTFTCLDENTIPHLYKALVRPHLEYGNVIWSPHTKKIYKK